ncbi:MAG TPA: hypothetical protein VD837_14775 [Terriglobales bacterium]|nr:hypothetical protein [Terriglobales bacterium]
MNCKDMRDRLLDLAAGATPDAETRQHLQVCEACTDELASLAQTMSLLDEWQAPEPSPYFDSRLQARLREEAAAPARDWFAWLRKPVLAFAMVGLMAVGVTLYQQRPEPESPEQRPQVAEVNAQPGSAVADLQNLDKNHDLYANFDLLDEIDQQGAEQDLNP